MLIGVIGAGGKSTACLRTAQALSDRSVLLMTTTHIYPVEPPDCRELLIDPEQKALLQALEQPGIVCAGTASREGKLASLSTEMLNAALARADVTVYEADGSKGRPLKLHRPFEPVLLPGTDVCLVLAGLSALGRPVGDVVHCYDRVPEWKEHPERPVSAEDFLFCVRETICTALGCAERILVLLNQADVLGDSKAGQKLCRELEREGYPCRVVSLKEMGD